MVTRTIKECPFRKSFWFRAAFEDGEEENTLSIVGQGDLTISSEPVELFKLRPSNN